MLSVIDGLIDCFLSPRKDLLFICSRGSKAPCLCIAKG